MLPSHAIGIECCHGGTLGQNSVLFSDCHWDSRRLLVSGNVSGLLLFSVLPSPLKGDGEGCQDQREPGVEVMRH